MRQSGHVYVWPAVEGFGAQCRTGVEDCFGQEAGSVEFGRGVVDWGGWSSPRMLQEVYRTKNSDADLDKYAHLLQSDAPDLDLDLDLAANS